MLETLAHNFIQMIQNNPWVGPLFAILAGVFTSLTPCALSNIPLVTGFVTVDQSQERRRPFFISLTFAIGSAVTFTVLGFLASAIGHVMGHSEILHMILGVLMLVMALQMWGIIHIIPHIHGMGTKGKKDFVGAFFTGMVGGIFSSHCATPVILMLLTMAAGIDNYLWGGILLICYAIGHGIIIVILGTSVAFANKLNDGAGDKTTKVIKILMGLLMFAIGVYMLLGD